MQDDAEPLETSFELNDTLFAKANIEKVDEVYLWLGVRTISSSKSCRAFGHHRPTDFSTTSCKLTNPSQANVMLSYPIPEAEELLTNKLSAAQQSLSNCEEDLDFLREQVTVRSWNCTPSHLVSNDFRQSPRGTSLAVNPGS